jgi:hypothetical protein
MIDSFCGNREPVSSHPLLNYIKAKTRLSDFSQKALKITERNRVFDFYRCVFSPESPINSAITATFIADFGDNN